VTRSLHKTLRNGGLEVRIDTAFEDVIDACAGPRRGSHGTRITSAMRHAYIDMHNLGHAHSVETWRDGELVGGLYGLAFGRAFFGESMFSRRTDASKVAFVALTNTAAALDLAFIDCQLQNPHLDTLGVRSVPRAAFLRWLRQAEAAPTPPFPRVPPPLEPIPWAR
jgi:leucyl/phenylalanyl-tRNA--protein transferase